MHFIYIDDSKDQKLACFSALIMPTAAWRPNLDAVLSIRRKMRASDGIYMRKELHGTEWNGGKGRLAPHPIGKGRRAQLFDFFLNELAQLQNLKIINAAVPYGEDERAFEYMMNRIQKNMAVASSECIILSDEGKNYDKLLRKMRVYNHIPSRLGQWETGKPSKNIVTDRILEDIVYRDSRKSYFIQAADFCAYALLRHESHLPSKNAYGLHLSFKLLIPILVRQANAKDSLGIIR